MTFGSDFIGKNFAGAVLHILENRFHLKTQGYRETSEAKNIKKIWKIVSK